MKNLLKVVSFMLIVVFFSNCNGSNTEANGEEQNTNTSINSKEVTIADTFQPEVGYVANGAFYISKDIELLKSNWEKVLNTNTELSVELDDVFIVFESGFYFIRGIDHANYSSSIVQLILIGDKLYEMKTSDGGSITSTCSGCTETHSDSNNECSPSFDPNTGYYCTDCSGGTCTKTTTKNGTSIL